MFIKIQYDVFSLRNSDNCLQRITFLSECISVLFRPATIIFTAKITFSLSPQVLGSEKTVDISRRYHWFPAK